MPLAHAGHWLVDLLYALPLVVMVAMLLAARARERRSQRSGGRPEDPAA